MIIFPNFFFFQSLATCGKTLYVSNDKISKLHTQLLHVYKKTFLLKQTTSENDPILF